MPRTLQDIFTDMLIEYRRFVIKNDRLIAEAKEVIAKGDKHE